MDRFAAKPQDRPMPPPAGRNAKLVSLLVILETLRQEPVPMRPQKV